MLDKILIGLLLVTVIAAGALGFTAYERGLKLDTAAATHKADTETIQRLTSASTDNAATIATLRGKLDKAAGQLQIVQAAQAAAQQQAQSAAHDRDVALAQLQDARSKLYATDHDAAAWAAGTVPAVLSDGLRNQWRSAAGHP